MYCIQDNSILFYIASYDFLLRCVLLYGCTLFSAAWLYPIFRYKCSSTVVQETPKTEKCSDWAENLTTYSSRYSKNFYFYPFIFYLALLKSFRIKCVFNFQTFLTVLCYELFLENGTLYFSFTSQEFITVEIVEISCTTTEIWQHLSKKSRKFCENALLQKNSNSFFRKFFMLLCSNNYVHWRFNNKMDVKLFLLLSKISSKNHFLLQIDLSIFRP